MRTFSRLTERVSDRAIFLILELDMPFDGVIQISQKPMCSALVHLGH